MTKPSAVLMTKPFSQLYSTYVYVHFGECMKQVPALFLVMPKRAVEDYKVVFEKVKELLGGGYRSQGDRLGL